MTDVTTVDEPTGSPLLPPYVLQIASEAAPFAKTGGLADVAGALPLALDAAGWRVLLVTPRYRGAPTTRDHGDSLSLTLGGVRLDATLVRHRLGQRSEVVLLDCPPLFDREGIYGDRNGRDYEDNALRYAFLAMGALQIAARREEAPAIIHAHDWQTGLTPLYARTHYGDAMRGAATVFTIHNVAYQGRFGSEWLNPLELGVDAASVRAVERGGAISFLKAGIVLSDRVTTVSRRYAAEMQTPVYGYGFEDVIRSRSADLVGIVNGIDTTAWDPERDPHLPRPFSARDLSGKRAAKLEMLRTFGLPVDEQSAARPVIGMVSRMVEQKGLDLIVGLGDEIVRLGATVVALGSGDARYQHYWWDQAGRFPGQVSVWVGFDERRAHLVEGGADIFMMPSRYEPCGLNQMYSQRYGTIPVVRATGGLDDTVEDFDSFTRKGTGFKFLDYRPDALLEALQRALRVYADDPEAWRGMMTAGMAKDFSWRASARAYAALYDELRLRVQLRRKRAGV